MRIITEPQWKGTTLTIPDLDMSGAFTGKAKFYVSNDPSGNDEVCEEVEIKEVPTHDSTPLFPKPNLLPNLIRDGIMYSFMEKRLLISHNRQKSNIRTSSLCYSRTF